MIAVKVLKDWKGEVLVDGSATLQALLDAVGAMPAGVPAADVESLIVKGRKLVVGEHASSSLAALGIADRTAVMLVRRRTSVGEVRREEERLRRLEEVRAALGVVWAASTRCEAAARKLAARVGGIGDASARGMSITNQDGAELELPEADSRALSLGCLLHAKGKELLDRSSRALLPHLACTLAADPPATDSHARPSDTRHAGDAAPAAPDGAPVEHAETAGGSVSGSLGAAEVAAHVRHVEDSLHLLEQACVAMEVCDGRWLSISDNVALLWLDATWAALLLHAHSATLATADAQRAAVRRLERARAHLVALHGPEMSRLAAREGTGAQRAVWVRLLLLQGAVAYERGDVADARSLLGRADALRRELTLGEEDDGKVAALVGMGFSAHEARAALLACGKDASRAATRVLERRREAEEGRARRKKQRAARRFGKTSAGKLVCTARLERLEAMGYEAEVAAEALRAHENDEEHAIGALTSPGGVEAISLAIYERRAAESRAEAEASRLSELGRLGFARADATAALAAAGGDLEKAVIILSASGPPSGPPAGRSATTGEPSEGAHAAPADTDGAKNDNDDGADDPADDAIARAGLHAAVEGAERAYEGCALGLEEEAIAIYLEACRRALG